MLLLEPTAIRQAIVALLGEPNARLSSGRELRYGNHGSLAIDLHKAAWFDHEHGTGGGILDLIDSKTDLTSRIEQI